MNLTISCFYLFVSVSVTVVNSKVDFESQIRIAQCRAACLYKISMIDVTDEKCKSSVKCSQCWDSCELLLKVADRHRHCSQPKCSVGCQEACRFLSLASPPSHPQTVEVEVPEGMSLGESPLGRVRAVLRSLGLALQHPPRRPNATDNYMPISGSQDNEDTSAHPWHLTLVSVAVESSLVLARISWSPRQDQLTYLVTWEVEGGVIRGNLLTNSSNATLSLWPDTSYTIQVSEVDLDSSGSRSEVLVLDTHHLEAAPPLSAFSPRGQHQSESLVVGAVLILLLASLATFYRWRQRLSLPHAKLVDECAGTPNIYRVFPPAVRLISESKNTYPELYSSTDNLLQSN